MEQTTATEEVRDEPSAAQAAEEYLASQQPAVGDFSMDLNQDQKDIRDWVHGFAEGVMRPAAADCEWKRLKYLCDSRSGLGRYRPPCRAGDR